MKTGLEEQNEITEFHMHPIGRIAAGDSSSWLWIDPPYRDGLTGLKAGAVLEVLWWLDGCDNETDRAHLLCGGHSEKGQQRGVFATHSPHRPNPIALSRTVIQAVDVQAGLIKTDPLDANDGSPLLDLKSAPEAGTCNK